MQTQTVEAHDTKDERKTDDTVATNVPDKTETLLEIDNLIDMKKFAEIFSYAG